VRVCTEWKFRLGGRNRIVTLGHDPSDGSGYITVDGLMRHCIGPRLTPGGGDFVFECGGRQCVMRIRFTSFGGYSYECEVVGEGARDRKRVSDAATLVRPGVGPDRPEDALLRPAAEGPNQTAEDLLHPVGDDCPPDI
jgi:hypothetical protein